MHISRLFESPNVPAYIQSWGGKNLKIAKEKYKGVKFTLLIEPFTPALASEISDELKAMLFKRSDGEPKRLFKSGSLNIDVKPQTIELRVDPTLKPSATLIDAKIEFVRMRESSEGNHLCLTMQVTLPDITAQDLLYLKEAATEQRFFTFDLMQGGLFAEAEAEERRASKDAKPVKKGRVKDDEPDLPAGEEVTAH
jgi:hypothetical protein